MPAKKYPLSKRFSVALSDSAYAKLRLLNEKYGYGNNYLLTILLENLDAFSDNDSLEKVFADFKTEYGAPTSGQVKSRK